MNGLPWFFGDVLIKTRHGQPPPLPQPYNINSHPQPRVASDPRNIRPLTYENRTQVQKIRPPRHRLEYAGISKPRPERIYDTSFEKEVPQPRVDAIKRGTSKRRRPPATIYPRDQDCRGHVEKIRRRASYLVRRKHDGSKGWMETPEPRVAYRRWDDKNLD